MDFSAPAFTRLTSRLRFRHFELLIALSGESSLRAAAQQMHLTQPALSRMLDDMERVLSVRLFERTSRGLRPTSNGIAATRCARQILEELGRVPQETALGEGVAAVVRIGAPHYVAHDFLPPLVARLTAQRPRIHVKLIERPVPDLFQALEDGEADALITTYTPQLTAGLRIPLRQQRLYDSKFRLIASVRHPIATRRGRLTLAQLVEEPWVLPTSGSILRQAVDWTFRQAGLLPPVPVLEANNPTTSMQFVAAGIGLGFAPMETLKVAAGGRVVPVRVSPAIADAPVALIHQARKPNPRVTLLREALGR